MSNEIKNDLRIIKKKYDEKMMHLCREYFSSILEEPGVLSTLLLSHFEPSRFLYDDIIKAGIKGEFVDFIYSLTKPIAHDLIYYNVRRTPKDLLDEAGYILYECKTEEDIQFFKKYYAKGEELCTFNGNRLKRCHVFFAVSKNVDSIKREDFNNPKRQDKYGTSVISIQFTKDKNSIISIKNRYNHTVDNPDATFSNNPDNIIPGLTGSFARHYNINLSNSVKRFEIPGYVMANNGKYYKYNYEINNIYYCEKNIIIDNFNVIDKYSKEPERYLVIDYFVIDLEGEEVEVDGKIKKMKTIKLYDIKSKYKDCFADELKDIEKINITKDKDSENKTIEVLYDNGKKATIVIDKTNKIIEYHNNNVTKVNDMFLYYNKVLSVLEMSNLEIVGNGFLRNNLNLTSFFALNLVSVGNEFLRGNKILSNFVAPNLKKIGHSFLYFNEGLTSLFLPNVIVVGNKFMYLNRELSNLDMSNLVKVGSDFLYYNTGLKFLQLLKLMEVGAGILKFNEECVLLIGEGEDEKIVGGRHRR